MRRLVTSAVLGMLGTALLVFSASAQDKALGVEGKTDYNRQGTKILGIVDGASDTATVRLRLTSVGHVILDQATTFPPTSTVSSGIDGVTIAAGGTVSSQPECVDLSAYSKVTLLLSWTTAAAADSDSVQIALKVFNKESAAWGTNDTQVFTNSVLRTATAADTTMTEPLMAMLEMSAAKIPRPTLYLYRSTATTANVNGTLKNTVYGLGMLNRLYAGNGGVAIDLTGMCGALNYVGLQASNWNGGKALQNFKAVFLCRR